MTATTTDGLIRVASAFDAAETGARLVKAIEKRGLLVFCRVDHAKNAAEISQELRPTELFMFGNPRGGTPLMQQNQTAGIDLPLHALVWQGADGKAWLAYNDPRWIVARHELRISVDAMIEGLAGIAREATSAG